MEYKGKIVFSKEQLKVLDLLEEWILGYCHSDANDIPLLMVKLREILKKWEKAGQLKSERKLLNFKKGGKK